MARELKGSEVRALGPADVADAYALSRLAGWNQTEADWHRLLALSPDGCWAIEVEGRVVATTTMVSYQRCCAWVGMVLTHPDWRGRGFARRLVGQVVAAARSAGIATIKLDATSQGQALYESLGFSPEQLVERWERPGTSSPNGAVQNYSLAVDYAAYGYCRRDLLETLGAAATMDHDAGGYALTRAGAIRPYVGPCIASNQESARTLLTHALDAIPGSGWFWDLLIENGNAAELAVKMGFQPVRRLVRMSMGARIRENEQNIYGLAGFEWG